MKITKNLLKAIADIRVGYQANTGIQEKTQGTHRLIQSKNFDSFHHLRPKGLISFSPDRKPETYSIHKGDILFQARGMEHFSYYIKKDLKDTIAAGSFYVISIKNKNLLPEYLSWWINQPKTQSYFQSQSQGSLMSFITKRTLSGLEVQIPPLSVQKKVIKIIALAEHEQFLLDRLSSLRSRLVKAVCLKAIQEQEK